MSRVESGLFKIAHLLKKALLALRNGNYKAESREGRCGQFISTRKAVQTAEAARKKWLMATRKRRKNRSPESLPKPTTQTNLIPSIIFSFFVLAPSAPVDGNFHSRGCRTAPTRKRTDPAGEILYTNQPGIRWSREQNCSADFILPR